MHKLAAFLWIIPQFVLPMLGPVILSLQGSCPLWLLCYHDWSDAHHCPNCLECEDCTLLPFILETLPRSYAPGRRGSQCIKGGHEGASDPQRVS